MEKKPVVVHLSLDDPLKDLFKGECTELKKNLGPSRDALVKEVFNYLMNPTADENNPQEYTRPQRELADFVKGQYNVKHIPSIIYQNREGSLGYMRFDEPLSKYPDAFHPGDSSREFGNLEEKATDENVFLSATPQDMGGKY